MIVFLFDKTFEGLLTAVFDAYSRKVFPDTLIALDEVLPLFTTDEYTVITQENKALRVWTALEKKLSRGACNMVTTAWLSDDEDKAGLLFRFIRKTIDNKVSIESNFGDSDILKMHQLAKKVSHEGHYLKQFVRFQKASDDIFFAPVAPLHNALPLIIDHFKDRFADQKWVIYDIKRHYGFYYNLETVEEITLSDDNHLLNGKLDEHLMAEDEKLFQDLWKGYFGAMTIKERLNLKLQKQHMPKRFWKYLTEKQ